jgi:hypothetical protein
MQSQNLSAAQRTHAPEGLAACVVEALRGVAYFRRGAWAAFLHTGELIGQFATAREASAALGGAA